MYNELINIPDLMNELNTMNAITNSTSVAVSNTDSTTQAIEALVAGGLIGFLVTFIIAMCFIGLVVMILTIIADWKIFEKAGEKGWKALIPIYNSVILFKVAGISPWWVVGYFFGWIPIVGPLLVFGITIYAMISLSKAFGKSEGFAVGLILLNTIFIMILGFDKSEYQLNKEAVEIKEADKTE